MDLYSLSGTTDVTNPDFQRGGGNNTVMTMPANYPFEQTLNADILGASVGTHLTYTFPTDVVITEIDIIYLPNMASSPIIASDKIQVVDQKNGGRTYNFPYTGSQSVPVTNSADVNMPATNAGLLLFAAGAYTNGTPTNYKLMDWGVPYNIYKVTDMRFAMFLSTGSILTYNLLATTSAPYTFAIVLKGVVLS